jgi:hypothetical protein
MQTLPLPGAASGDDYDYSADLEARVERWAHTKIRCSFDGRVPYSEFLAKKVAKVFPDIVPRELWQNFESTSEPSTRHVLTVPVPEKISTSKLVAAIEKNRQRVLKHPVYETIHRAAQGGSAALVMLHQFMEHHVWAVWDYFQLLKRLQQELTCTTLPWVPKGDPQLRRFVTEIVLEEETDITEDGATYGSHLELYLRGMRQAGADAGPMERFLDRISNDKNVNAKADADALATIARDEGAPPAAVAFILSTCRLAAQGSVAEVAAVFTFGREDVIPGTSDTF